MGGGHHKFYVRKIGKTSVVKGHLKAPEGRKQGTWESGECSGAVPGVFKGDQCGESKASRKKQHKGTSEWRRGFEGPWEATRGF